MTTGKELVFIFLWTLTRCVAIQLNLWDQSSENWKVKRYLYLFFNHDKSHPRTLIVLLNVEHV